MSKAGATFVLFTARYLTGPVSCKTNHGGYAMIGWAVTFLVIAIIAAILGFTGIAGTAVQIAWILFVVGLILALVFFVMGRRPPI
ncbi:DUF1328 domain-containing protein [Methylocaldum sp. MU1018]